MCITPSCELELGSRGVNPKPAMPRVSLGTPEVFKTKLIAIHGNRTHTVNAMPRFQAEMNVRKWKCHSSQKTGVWGKCENEERNEVSWDMRALCP